LPALQASGRLERLLRSGARFVDKAIVLDAFDRGEAPLSRPAGGSGSMDTLSCHRPRPSIATFIPLVCMPTFALLPYE
jgi:hypothetical protein